MPVGKGLWRTRYQTWAKWRKGANIICQNPQISHSKLNSKEVGGKANHKQHPFPFPSQGCKGKEAGRFTKTRLSSLWSREQGEGQGLPNSLKEWENQNILYRSSAKGPARAEPGWGSGLCRLCCDHCPLILRAREFAMALFATAASSLMADLGSVLHRYISQSPWQGLSQADKSPHTFTVSWSRYWYSSWMSVS